VDRSSVYQQLHIPTHVALETFWAHKDSHPSRIAELGNAKTYLLTEVCMSYATLKGSI
jgi:hypothetical protein